MYEISLKLTLFVIGFISIICGVYYILYQRAHKTQQVDLSKKIADSIMHQVAQGIYLYSNATKTLYFKDKTGVFSIIKNGSNCDVLMDKKIDIKDVTYSCKCSDVPDQYKDKCIGIDQSKYITIMIQSASEYEDSIKKQNPAIIVPDNVMCNDTSSDPQNADSSDIVNMAKQKLNNMEDVISSHASELERTAITLGVIVAASHFAQKAVLILMVLPMLLSDDTVTREKGGVFAGVFLAPLLLKSFCDYLKESKAKSSIASEGIVDTTAEVYLNGARDAILEVREFISTAVDYMMAIPGVNIIATFIEVLMVFGMFFDALDICGLQSDRFNQDLLYKYKTSNDEYMSQIYADYIYPFDATKICDYNLMKSADYWDNCMSDEKKNGLEKDIYTKDENDKLNQYSNEYLLALKYNSYGSTIKPIITNEQYYGLLTKYVSNVDWTPIRTATSQSTLKYLFDSKIIAELSLVFTDDNVIVANYVAHYKYVFLSFMIILLSIIFYTK